MDPKQFEKLRGDFHDTAREAARTIT